ncbi:hypothetical protein D3C79_1001760 [compost metagenome]
MAEPNSEVTCVGFSDSAGLGDSACLVSSAAGLVSAAAACSFVCSGFAASVASGVGSGVAAAGDSLDFLPNMPNREVDFVCGARAAT